MAGMAQVGVKTRARALALAAAATATGSSRKRKVENEEIVSYIELKSATNRRRVMITPENSLSVSPPMDSDSGQPSFIQDRCKSFASSDHASASCCSSNGSSDQRIHQFADLEDESVEVETSVYYSCRERRETAPSSQLRAESSEELDSMARPTSAENSRRRSTATKMPTEAELDEFFTEAEKNIQKRFADKYNYDIVKDEPLEGRYEWVRLKP
ncbi:cyclin-dependent kinase inhibitor 7-like [Euphorbia lathyris]|uniref:cyclin-dependent kinase inhibitor 7-like n=1 Tax=Euphorbia lathyris TaxID=212925 RepID=UPI003313BA2A